MGERLTVEDQPVAIVTRPLVELRNVTKRYGPLEVFRELTLRIGKGEHFAILGPSGCGKSTVLRLIAGLDSPTKGEVWLEERRASTACRLELQPHQREIALVFQDLALWPNLTVLENVELGLAGAKLSRPERRNRAFSALRVCRIEEQARRRPAELSGGQQQRTALARALALQPKALLLDEPFSGLDIAIKGHLFAEIRRMCEEFDVTVILVSHDPLEATALCSFGAVIEDGRVIEEGTFRELLQSPQSATLRAFVEQLPQSPNAKPTGNIG